MHVTVCINHTKVGVGGDEYFRNLYLPLITFPLKILDYVSSSGRGAGIAASGHRGSPVKENEVSNWYEYFK